MAKIKVEADLSGLNAELDKIDRTAGEIASTFNEIGKGLNPGQTVKALGDVLKQAEAIADVLGEKMESGLLSPRQMEQAARSFGKIADAAGKTTNNLKYGEKVPDWISGVSREFSGAAKQAAIVEKTQANLAAQGRRRSREEVQESERKFNELIRQEKRFHAFKGKSLDEITGGGWRNASADPQRAERMREELYRAAGIDRPGGSNSAFARSAFAQVGHSVAQALPGGNIIANAASAASDAESGGGLAAFGKVGLAGGIAFGAYKLVSGIMDKLGAAQDQAVAIGDLNHAVQGSASDFDQLRKSIFEAGKAFGATNEETAQLASIFAKTAGRLDVADVAQSGGFARAYGIAPAQSAQFFASMRLSGVTRNDADSKRLAMYIGEAVGRSGASGKMEEFMAVAGSFIQHAAQSSFSAPNAEAYLGLLGSMTGRNAGVGLAGNPMNAGAMISKADAAARRGGTSEASHLFWLGAMRGKGVNAYDLPYQLEGGLLGSAEESFGRGSSAYLMAMATRDEGQKAHLDALAKAGGTETNLDRLIKFARAQTGGNAIGMSEAMQATLGLSARESANFYARYNAMGGSGGISKRLADAGIKLGGDEDPATVAKLVGLVGGGREDWEKQAKHLQTLPNVPKEIKEALSHANETGDKELQKMVLEQTKLYDEFKSEGDMQRDSQNRMNASLQRLADELIPATIKIKEAILWVAENRMGMPAPGSPDHPDFVGPPGPGDLRRLTMDVLQPETRDRNLRARMQNWSPMQWKLYNSIQDESKRQDFPPAIALALADTESGMSPYAIGKKITDPNSAHYGDSAYGAFQYMAKSSSGWDRRDMGQNVAHGIADLKKNYLRFLPYVHDDKKAMAMAIAAHLTGPNKSEYMRGEFPTKGDGNMTPEEYTRAITGRASEYAKLSKEYRETNSFKYYDKLPAGASASPVGNQKTINLNNNATITLLDANGQLRGSTVLNTQVAEPIPPGWLK